MADFPGATTSLSRSVRLLRIVQHFLFTLMVVVGVMRSGFEDGVTVGEVVAASALLGWYWAGAAPMFQPQLSSRLWLVVLSGLCLSAVWVSADFAWVSFAVFVAFATTLGPGFAVIAMVALALGTGAILIGRWPSEGHWAAQVVGPLLGAAAVGALVGVGRLAAAEVAERQRLLDELLATRDDLARAHLDAGARGERERLTREIHDTLAQGFTSVVLGARRARRAAETGDTAVTTREIAQLEELGRSGVEAARRLMSHLTPVELDDRSLSAALVLLSAPGSGPEPPVIDVRVDGDVLRLPGKVEGALLRVAQEAVANVRRHAHAERVVITLTYQRSAVSLDIVDDGVGFDPASAGSGGFGLRSMRSRIEQLGGSFHIDSELDQGSAVNVTIDVPTTPAGSLQ